MDREKGTATKVLHEQKIDPSQVYNIQHINLTDSPKNAINSQENLIQCTRNPRKSSRIFSKIHENPTNSRDFLKHPTYKLDRFPQNVEFPIKISHNVLEILENPQELSQTSMKIHF